MPGKTYKREKLQSLSDIAVALFADLKEAGFTQILPATGLNFTPSSGAGKFVFESSAAINPRQAKQPYRILVDLEGATAFSGRLRIAIAGPQQITNAGATATFPGAADTTGLRVMGQLGNAWSKTTGQALGDCFITRNIPNRIYDSGSTISYLLVVTNRGFALSTWEDASDESPVFSFLNVQVPVDKDSGAPLAVDNSPIFCVFNSDNTGLKKFVVNEADVFRPTKAVAADRNTVNSSAIVNSAEQVSIARGNKYLVSFANRLNTERYAYTEELDQFAYVSADVIGEGTEVSVTVYGESTPRVYRALKANGANNTGMRLLMLVEGGGVPNV